MPEHTDPPGRTATVPDAPTELRRVVSADGTGIVLERVTRGEHDLLMLPGSVARRSVWTPVAALLDGRYTCWLMDRRGKGDSDDTEPYGLEREYADVAAAAASLDGPVTLAGHSSGAICALGGALRGAPIAQLVLYEPPWPVVREPVPTGRVDAIDALVAAGDRDGALELALREMVGVPQPAIDAMRGSPAWAERCALVHTWPREMREVETLPDVSELGAITVPTLMIYGTRTTQHLRDSTTAVAEVLPSARVVGLQNEAHYALLTAPDVVAEAILAGTAR